MKQVLFNIHVITGWQMPADEFHKQALYSQFEKKLLEDYGSLNAQEIEFAFRSGGTTIEDWGKVFNLNLLDKVLIPYLHRRASVREMTEKQRVDLPSLPGPAADWKEMCEYYYQQFLTGTYNLSLWPWQMYDEFVRCEMMAEDFYTNAVNSAETHLRAKYVGQITREELCGNKVSVRELQAKIEAINAKQGNEVIYLAKKMAVRYLYQQAKKQNIEHLFVKTEE
jgi:hypothetical protein